MQTRNWPRVIIRDPSQRRLWLVSFCGPKLLSVTHLDGFQNTSQPWQRVEGTQEDWNYLSKISEVLVVLDIWLVSPSKRNLGNCKRTSHE
jgi:hypothetical protein